MAGTDLGRLPRPLGVFSVGKYAFQKKGSMLSKNFDDSVTIMARIRLARIMIALTKPQKAIFGTRRVALESKKTAYESLVPVLSLLLCGSMMMARNAGL